MMPAGVALDLTGQQFDDWYVKRFLGRKKGNSIWLCVCKCGREKWISTGNLRSGASTRCNVCAHPPAMITIKGETHTVKEWAKIKGIGYKLLYDRLKTMSPEQAVKEVPQRKPQLGKMITFREECHNITGWAKKLGISRVTLYKRLETISLAKALTLPPTNKTGQYKRCYHCGKRVYVIKSKLMRRKHFCNKKCREDFLMNQSVERIF